MKPLRGTITVFLALIFVCVSALVLTLVESARTAGLKFHLETAAGSAMDSLFSEYHNGLWDRYRILAYECEDMTEAENSAMKYMDPYIKVKSWMGMDEVTAGINKISYLTDTGGEWLEQEIIDYMNYGLTEELFDVSAAEELDDLWKDLKEAEAMEEITADYAEKSKEALKVEQALMDINKSLNKQKEVQGKAVSALHSGSNGSFQRYADQMINEMEKVTGKGGDGGLVCVYEDGSYELEKALNEIDENHASAYADINSDEGKEIIRSVKDDYLGYSAEEKNRRAQVEEIYSVTIDNIEAVRRSKEAADMIEEYEAAIEDDEDYDYSEIRDLWYELADVFASINIPGLDFEFGVADEREKGFLESAKDLLGSAAGDGLLALIVPEGRSVSNADIDMSGAPSLTCMGTDRTTEYRTVIENVLIAEYAARYFSEFTDDTEDPVRYEMEYICAGKTNDRDNLSSAAGKVFAIREGMNYLSIMRDGNKRAQARHLAEEIVIGASGGTLTALVPVVECLIIGVWSGAESVTDCRALLKGNRVSLVKQPSEWKLDVSSILNWGESRHLSGPDSGDDRGLDYENYLKFIILLLFSETRNYRMMDIMQINTAANDEDFEMKNCVYGTDMEFTAAVKHLFTSIPMISGETIGLARDFTIKTNAVKAY